MKILVPLVFIFMSTLASAQRSLYTTTADNVTVPKEASFDLSVIPEKSSATLRLSVYNPEQKNIKLQISHPVDGLLVDTTFSDVHFSRRYNFEQVDDGRYKVVVVSGKEKIAKNVEINTVTMRNIVIQ